MMESACPHELGDMTNADYNIISETNFSEISIFSVFWLRWSFLVQNIMAYFLRHYH